MARAAGLIVVLVAAACGGAARGSAALDPVAQARADSARLPYTAADVRFITGMIHHHGQAITMSRLVEENTTSQDIRTLAARIINAQTDEIALMQAWLRDRNQPVPEPSPTGMRMTMGGMEHDMLMPGMLTESQMQELRDAKGATFDRRFLELMIHHHRGALTMVKELLDSPGAALDETTFRLAADINADQSTEIARMQQMLIVRE